MDVSTVLLSDVPGTELSPQETVEISSHQEADIWSPPQEQSSNDGRTVRQEPAPVTVRDDKPLPDDGLGVVQPVLTEPAVLAGGEMGTAVSRAFANTMNAQAIAAHLMRYRMTASAHLRGGLGRALPVEERRSFDDAAGTVLVTFLGGAVASLAVETENDRLRTLLLERIDWASLPAPRQFSLPISRVACTVSVSNGKIRVGVGPI